MTQTELTLALLALLITPGPTNAVLALAGAQGGVRAGLRLIPVVAVCYGVVVIPLAIWGAPLMDQLPLLRPVLTGLAAAWVARLACGLWHLPAQQGLATMKVTVRETAVTTLLNPKSLIFGGVLIPSAPLAGMVGFAVLVPLVSALWVTLGAGVLARSGLWLNKGAAIWMGLLAVLLAAKAFAG